MRPERNPSARIQCPDRRRFRAGWKSIPSSSETFRIRWKSVRTCSTSISEEKNSVISKFEIPSISQLLKNAFFRKRENEKTLSKPSLREWRIPFPHNVWKSRELSFDRITTGKCPLKIAENLSSPSPMTELSFLRTPIRISNSAPRTERLPHTQCAPAFLFALKKAALLLGEFHPGYRIKIYDAYRPMAVQSFMVDHVADQYCRKVGESFSAKRKTICAKRRISTRTAFGRRQSIIRRLRRRIPPDPRWTPLSSTLRVANWTCDRR